MNFAKITQEYYSGWLGEYGLLENALRGVHFVHSPERNRAQYGDSDPFHLYAFCQPGRTIISYGDAPAGINTLPKHRSHSYAADACIAAAREIIQQDQCPIWSTSIANIASQKLIERIGFIPYAEVVTLTL